MARAAITPATAAAPHLSRCMPAMTPPALMSKPPAGGHAQHAAHVPSKSDVSRTGVVRDALANQKDSLSDVALRLVHEGDDAGAMARHSHAAASNGHQQRVPWRSHAAALANARKLQRAPHSFSSVGGSACTLTLMHVPWNTSRQYLSTASAAASDACTAAHSLRNFESSRALGVTAPDVTGHTLPVGDGE